jgi:very-short-patch-repair endonuclease
MILQFSDTELQFLLGSSDKDIVTFMSSKIKRKEDLLNKKIDCLKVSASKLRKSFIANESIYEKKFKKVLIELKVEFEFQKIFYLNEKEFYIADFYLPDYDTIFEIGYFKDKYGQRRIMDKVRRAYLKDLGIKHVYRIDNLEVRKDTESLLSTKVDTILNTLV